MNFTICITKLNETNHKNPDPQSTIVGQKPKSFGQTTSLPHIQILAATTPSINSTLITSRIVHTHVPTDEEKTITVHDSGLGISDL